MARTPGAKDKHKRVRGGLSSEAKAARERQRVQDRNKEWREAGMTLCCRICNRHFVNLPSHIWQRHGISVKQYKKQFGIPMKDSLLPPEISKFRSDVAKYHDMASKLLVAGVETRFKRKDGDVEGSI